jgi:hypothetical protein
MLRGVRRFCFKGIAQVRESIDSKTRSQGAQGLKVSSYLLTYSRVYYMSIIDTNQRRQITIYTVTTNR